MLLGDIVWWYIHIEHVVLFDKRIFLQIQELAVLFGAWLLVSTRQFHVFHVDVWAGEIFTNEQLFNKKI